MHVLMCHTQFDFGILCEQNILSLNVSVNHMMGVKMGKTLEDKQTHTINAKSQMVAINMKSLPFTFLFFFFKGILNEEWDLFQACCTAFPYQDNLK